MIGDKQVKIEMYEIKEFPSKYQIVCDHCQKKGFVDPSCNNCGGKGTRNKTINVWDVCKRKEDVIRIDRENKDGSDSGSLRYWTSSCDFYREQSKLLHFTYNDAKNECNLRNKGIQHIIDNKKIFSKHPSDNVEDFQEVELFDKKIWTRQDGTRIRVSDMSNQHIQNTINFLKRESRCLEWVDVFLEELIFRGIHDVEGYIYISFKNNGNYTKSCIQMPIKFYSDMSNLSDKIIGAITDVNDNFVNGVIWSRYAYEEMCSGVPCCFTICGSKT